MKIFNTLWLISAIVMTIAGIYCVFNPPISTILLLYIVAAVILFNGVMSIIEFNIEWKRKASGWILFDGIVSVPLSLFIMLTGASRVMALVVLLVFTIWVVIKGVAEIINANSARRSNKKYWYILLIIGIISIIVGIFSQALPSITSVAFALSIVFAVRIGVFLILLGIASASLWFLVGKLKAVQK